LNGELISRSKCKPAALPVHSQKCIQKAIYVTNPADTVSTETQQNQATNTQIIQTLPDKTDLIEQIGDIEILFLDDYKEENQQTIVFLPEPVPIVSFPNSSQLTIPAISDQAIEGSINTASSQQQPVDVDISFPEELFWTQSIASLPLNDIIPGELNTPEIGKLTTCMFFFDSLSCQILSQQC
jgi:hypothetical protein